MKLSKILIIVFAFSIITSSTPSSIFAQSLKSLQIAKACVKDSTFIVNSDTLKLLVRAWEESVILENVHVYCVLYYGDRFVTYEILDQHRDNAYFELTQTGTIYIFCVLKSEVSMSKSEDETIYYSEFYIGEGDGTGRDFDDGGLKLAANVYTKMLPNTEKVSKTPIKSYPDDFRTLNYFGNYSIDFRNKNYFDYDSDIHSTMAFQIRDAGMFDKNKKSREWIEASVWIHVFDHDGTLLGIIKKKEFPADENIIDPEERAKVVQGRESDNNNFTMDLSQDFTGFRFLPLVRPRVNGKDIIFEIGDPKKDAEVQVEEIE